MSNTDILLFWHKKGSKNMNPKKLILLPPNPPNTIESPLRVQMVGIDYCLESYRIVRSPASISVIGYVSSGSGTFHIGGKTFTAVAGDTFFIPAGTHQEYYPSSSEPWVFLWFNIQGPLIISMLEAYGLAGRNLFTGCSIEHLLRKGLSIAESKRDIPMDRLQKSMNTIVMETIMEIVHFQSGTQNVVSADVMKIKNFLDRQLEEHISLSQLKKITPFTIRHINRIFRKELGTTPYNYLLDNKIEMAKSLLLNTNLPVSEIAAKLKFSDPYYFSNMFKRKTGLSPMHFRSASNSPSI
jgi:AraC family transcriptional regulator of arabinose operon